jgi:hypothetical protein
MVFVGEMSLLVAHAQASLVGEALVLCTSQSWAQTRT